MTSKSTLSLKNMLLFFTIVLAMSSGTFLNPTYRYGVLVAIVLLLFGTGHYKLRKTPICLVYTLFSIFVAIGIFYSPDKSSTVKLVIVYLSCCLFVNSRFDEQFFDNVFDWFEKVSLFFAITILIEVVVPSILPKLYFLTNKTEASILKDIRNGAFAGLAGDRAEAAVIMCVAIALCWAKYCAKTEKISRLSLKMALFYIALMLTSKRTLFVCSLVIPFLVLVMFAKGKRKYLLVVLAATGVFACIIMIPRVPALQNIFLRLQDTEDLLTMNGRTKCWNVSKDMFATSPIIGHGLNSFNLLANRAGVRFGGSLALEWIYQGHNSYLQLLGELGIIGFSLYIVLQFLFFGTGIRMIMNKSQLKVNELLGVYFAVFIMIVFALYSYTGNCEYYMNQVFIQAIMYSYISNLNSVVRWRGKCI